MSVASDGQGSVQLMAEVNYLRTGDGTSTLPDQAALGFLLDANSRLGIQYAKTGPSSFPGPLSIPSSRIDTGISCGGSSNVCGAWVNLPTTFVYYGAPARSGNYNQLWVCANGYVSLTQDTRCNNYGYLGPGIIAPFSRSLWMDSASHVWYWTVYNNGYNLFIAWDNMMDGSILTYQNRESFVLWISDSSFGPHGISPIEFLYNSITPNDGMVTAVGIADQYGKNTVTVDPTTLANNQEVQFTETNSLRYINSLALTIAETSNGLSDSNAKIVFDSSQTPVAYNLLMMSTIADSSTLLPAWAKLTMDGAGVATGVYATMGLVAASTVGAGGLLIGIVPLAMDTYDTMIHNYWDPKLEHQCDQGGILPSCQGGGAQIRATGSQDGSTSGLIYLPEDANIGAKLLWSFLDNSRSISHHLTLTATLGYTDSAYAGLDTWILTTSVDLDIVPSYQIFTDSFEPPFNTMSPFTAPSGTYAWTATSNCPLFNSQPNCYEGSWVAYAQDVSSVNAQAVLSLGSLVNYDQLVVNPHFWIDTKNSPETFFVEYYSQGAWTVAASYNGMISTSGYRAKEATTQWINPMIVVPSTTTMLRFRFALPQGISCCSGAGQGIYIDDIWIFGTGPAGYSPVTVNAQTTTGTAIPAPIAIANTNTYYPAQVSFLEPAGTYTLYTMSQFMSGPWTYYFQRWSDGITATSDQISVPQTQSLTAIFLQAPIASFTYSPHSYLQPGQQITFSATASGGTSPYSFAWSFGDTTSGSGNLVTHTYSSSGYFQVTLTVTDSAGLTGKYAQTLSVQVNPPLSTSLTFMPSNIIQGQPVTFVSSVQGGFPPYSYQWSSAGANPSSGTSYKFTTTYPIHGTYETDLTVTDSKGASRTTSYYPTAAPPPITTDFTYSPASPSTGQTVTFTSTTSGGSCCPYPSPPSWTFGDGTTATGNTVTHSYGSTGTYLVTETATDAASATATAVKCLLVGSLATPCDYSMSFIGYNTQNVNSLANYKVSISGVNGFSGSVSLSASMLGCQTLCGGGAAPDIVGWTDTGTSQTTVRLSSCPSHTCTESLAVESFTGYGQFMLGVTGSCNGCGATQIHSLYTDIEVQCNPNAGSQPGDFCIWPEASSVDAPVNGILGDWIYLDSYAGYGGSVSLSAAVSACFNNCGSGTAPIVVWNDSRTAQTSAVIDPTSSSCKTGPDFWCNESLLIVYQGTATGEYTITVSAVCLASACALPASSHSLAIDLWVDPAGGGGSVAAGTLIMLADGSQIAAQNLKVGMQLLSYDMSTHQFVNATITRYFSVVTNNQMEISTSTGKPLIVDQNPAQKLYVQLSDGTVTLTSVTQLSVGNKLLDPLSDEWVPITALHYQDGGTHVMYDIYTTTPGNYIANGILDPLKT